MTKNEKAVQDLIRKEREKILDLKYAPEDVAFLEVFLIWINIRTVVQSIEKLHLFM